MNRPYIICHMVTSLDGKVTGDFLFKPECEGATEIYYDINRKLKCILSFLYLTFRLFYIYETDLFFHSVFLLYIKCYRLLEIKTYNDISASVKSETVLILNSFFAT